jgi:hypothetical protein
MILLDMLLSTLSIHAVVHVFERETWALSMLNPLSENDSAAAPVSATPLPSCQRLTPAKCSYA